MNTLFLMSLLFLSPGIPQETGVLPWSTEQKAAAIAGCRYSIMSHALRDYHARHNLPDTQLPANFVAPTRIEPYLAPCDCVIQTISSEISLGEFSAQTPAVQGEVERLMSVDGACAPKLSPHPSISLRGS